MFVLRPQCAVALAPARRQVRPASGRRRRPCRSARVLSRDRSSRRRRRRHVHESRRVRHRKGASSARRSSRRRTTMPTVSPPVSSTSSPSSRGGRCRSNVELVTHSTTQAVNALLEGDVAKVGMIGMGRAPDLRKARKRTIETRIELSEGRTLATMSRVPRRHRRPRDRRRREAVAASARGGRGSDRGGGSVRARRRHQRGRGRATAARSSACR